MPSSPDHSSTPAARAETPRARLGIPGLDQVLGGGLPRDHLYLIDGDPGTGKTTLALQFLLDGRVEGERGLYITLSETADELRGTAASHGWSLEGIEIFELASTEQTDGEAYTLFHPAEIELNRTVETVLAVVDRIAPARVVFDSLSEMRLIARDPLRFRRQILALKQFFVGRGSTVLLLDDRSAPEGDRHLHSIAHGVVSLEHLATEYGSERRRLQVAKLRGLQFRGGYHDFRIRTGGLDVFPRILTETRRRQSLGQELRSGSGELDRLVGGGLPGGTSTLISGAAGTGKSVLSTQYALAAVASGARARYYLFDERMPTFEHRAAQLEMNVADPIADGRLTLRQIEPTAISPGEFADEIRSAVEEDDIGLVVIDSINGYMQAMPSERLLAVQVHELLSYMADRGVSTIMTLVQHGAFGGPVGDAADVSYLADTVILLRYFEHAGAVRQAISVVKKRAGFHERAIRECRVDRGGFRVGEPLGAFEGVLRGVPRYIGKAEPLMAEPIGPGAPLGDSPLIVERPYHPAGEGSE